MLPAKPKRNSQQMFPLVEQFEESKLTQKEFCSQYDLPLPVFQYWLKKFRSISNKQPQPVFIPLDVSNEKPDDGLMHIRLPNGIVITIPVE